jgi:hypothetical protein
MLGRFSAIVTICSRSAVVSERVGRLRKLFTTLPPPCAPRRQGDVVRLRVIAELQRLDDVLRGRLLGGENAASPAGRQGRRHNDAGQTDLSRLVDADIFLSQFSGALGCVSRTAGGAMAGRAGPDVRSLHKLISSGCDGHHKNSIIGFSRSSSVPLRHPCARRCAARDGFAGIIMPGEDRQERPVDPRPPESRDNCLIAAETLSFARF